MYTDPFSIFILEVILFGVDLSFTTGAVLLLLVSENNSQLSTSNMIFYKFESHQRHKESQVIHPGKATLVGGASIFAGDF